MQALPLKLPTRRNVRWFTGMVLMSYVAAHLGNHALGLVSLAAAEAAREVVHAMWRSPPATLLLYGSLFAHLSLAFVAVWERHTLRMPAIEALRLVLGFALPLLLASHVAATRVAQEWFALDPSYARVVRALWNPKAAALQLALMVGAWTHACIGVHLVYRARLGYQRRFHLWFALALLLPALAALGFVSMAREIAWGAIAARAPTPAQRAAFGAAADALVALHLAALAALLAARAWRARRERASTIVLTYPDRAIRVPRGWTVLEASRAHGIAHLSLCGGRARCSTCRVRVRGALQEPPDPDERRTLERLNAPPDVRLACQLRVRGDLDITPLFVPQVAAVDAGVERDVAVLFVDLRRWSGLAENHWPHDLVYMLDRYFAAVGSAVREAGGVPNQFIGDSVMAIFGLEVDLPTACRQAVDAARRIDERLIEWNERFAADFGQPVDFGMGLHAGRAAVAEVGHEGTTSLTAVGEVVNTASRLQEHSKVAGARLVMSLDSARLAGVAALGEPVRVALRGRQEPLEVLCVREPARDFSAFTDVR